jgi:cell division protein FtsL
MTDPTFITALATLITAVALLMKQFQTAKQQEATHETLRQVDAHTNGQFTALSQAVADLRSKQATPGEMAARTDDQP